MVHEKYSLKIGSHYFRNLNKSSKFYNERLQLVNWLNGSREGVLVLHCNYARLVQDLNSYVMGKPYENLRKDERGKAAIKEKANLVYFMVSNVDKFCKDSSIDIRHLTRDEKNADGNYYSLFILMTTEKWDEITNN